MLNEKIIINESNDNLLKNHSQLKDTNDELLEGKNEYNRYYSKKEK